MIRKKQNKGKIKSTNLYLYLILLTILIFLVFALTRFFAKTKTTNKSRAETIINSDEDSSVSETTQQSVFKNTNVLYASNTTGPAIVAEYISQMGANSLLPQNFLENNRLVDQKTDSLNTNHYIYQQKANLDGRKIPFYKIYTVVHASDQGIYALDSGFTPNLDLPQISSIDERIEKARQKALDVAKINFPDDQVTLWGGSSTVVLNFQALGESEDPKNYLTEKIEVISKNGSSYTYFIDLESLEVKKDIKNSLGDSSVTIYQCDPDDFWNWMAFGLLCQPVSSSEAQTSIDLKNLNGIIKDANNYYKNTYNLESFSEIRIWLNKDCARNEWQPSSHILILCTRYISHATYIHELAHSIMEKNGLLVSDLFQGKSIEEAFADLFSYGYTKSFYYPICSPGGPKRILNDPGFNKYLKVLYDCRTGEINPDGDCSGNYNASPDSLFSANYNCNLTVDDPSGQAYTNSGVVTKAFSLMIEGGDLNGCRIEKIGKEKISNSVEVERALLIINRIIQAVYLKAPPVNFGKLYLAMQRACYDLYGEKSTTCENVTNALKATKMDQQPLNTTTAAECTRRFESSSSKKTIMQQDPTCTKKGLQFNIKPTPDVEKMNLDPLCFKLTPPPQVNK